MRLIGNIILALFIYPFFAIPFWLVEKFLLNPYERRKKKK